MGRKFEKISWSAFFFYIKGNTIALFRDSVITPCENTTIINNPSKDRQWSTTAFLQDLSKQTLVKIFAGSLRIFKDLQRPTRIFKDLQRSYKDPQRQGSLKDPQRYHEDLFKILWRSWQRSLQRSFQGSLRIFKELIRILKDLKRILPRIFKRSLSGSLRILKDIAKIFQGSFKDLYKDLWKIFVRILEDIARILKDL